MSGVPFKFYKYGYHVGEKYQDIAVGPGEKYQDVAAGPSSGKSPGLLGTTISSAGTDSIAADIPSGFGSKCC